jgi:hypothetical protein
MASQAALQACSFLLARLAEEVTRHQAITYPGHHPGPKKWLSMTTGVLETADSYLARALSDPSAPTAQNLLNDAEELGEIAYKFLSYASGADATDIPHQVVAPFQRWAKALGITNTIFFRAEHLSNYELGWWDVSNLAKDLDNPAPSLTAATADIAWPLLRVTVPSHAMGMLTHFGVVAHELGHAIQDNIVCDFSPQIAVGTEVQARITARLAALGIAMGREQQVRFGEILRSWINELKADAVGLLVAGPAFFFALFAFLELTGRQYGISGTHPPSDLRRRHLFARLGDGPLSFRDVLLADVNLTLTEDLNSPSLPACPLADQLFAEISGRQNSLDAAIVVELIPYANAVADIIFNAARAYLTANCPSLIYSPTNFRADIADFTTPLCALIPPIERLNTGGQLEAASLASILNVGWVVLLAKLNEVPSPPAAVGENSRKMERLHELLLKAVELSEARRIWEENR